MRDDPDLWPAAVEEILRLDSPVQMTARTAGCDVEIAGHHIAAGDMVALLLGGANRDPQVSSFDITRANARDRLAFASGVHACLGAALARIEGATALRVLFETFPDLRLTAPPQQRGWSTCTDSSGCQRNWAAGGQHSRLGPDHREPLAAPSALAEAG